MPQDATPRSTARPVDAGALARIRQRLACAPQAPWLHGEVARRMAERLTVVRLQPGAVLDWHAHLGASRTLLRRAYPRARVMAVETGAPPAGSVSTSPWWSPRRWTATAPALEAAAVPAAQAQLLWSNMALHGEADPQVLMRRWQQALAVDGFLMFSTLGPGTLQGLRSLYRQAGWPPPHAPFVDMHDLGDMLVEAGFADPVMDQETVTLTWADPAALLAELRSLGGNADPARVAGLRTPRWRALLLQRLAAARADGGLRAADGRLALDFEIVYGHAFKAAPRLRVQGTTRVDVDDLRTMARRPRPGT